MSHRFEMFSAAGEAAVEAMCLDLARQIAEDHARIPTRRDAIRRVLAEMHVVSKTHSEVFDTEPHWAICDATAKAFRARGWEPYHRLKD